MGLLAPHCAKADSDLSWIQRNSGSRNHVILYTIRTKRANKRDAKILFEYHTEPTQTTLVVSFIYHGSNISGGPWSDLSDLRKSKKSRKNSLKVLLLCVEQVTYLSLMLTAGRQVIPCPKWLDKLLWWYVARIPSACNIVKEKCRWKQRALISSRPRQQVQSPQPRELP